MPNKRKYDVTFGNQNKNNKREKLEDEDEPNFIDVDMDIFDMGNSVSVRDNHIYFYGNVNTRNAIKLNTAIKDIRKKLMNVRLDYQVDNLKIFLHINSFGGSVFAGLSIIDTIIDSDIPIVSIVEGSAASAGFWGKMEEIKDEFINLKKLTKKLKGIYKKHTNIEKDKLKSLLKRDLWLDSAECLELGLVDRVE